MVLVPYLITFFEGIITFISPCLLPMLPIYIMYFAGGGQESQRKTKTLTHALGFVLGFTIVFVTLGAFAGSIGRYLTQHQTIVNLVAGAMMVFFGLSFLEILPWRFFTGNVRRSNVTQMSLTSSILFGMIFSIGWTPCVGTFLGAALLFASQQASIWKGILMLFTYSLGLGIPFVISALLIEQLKSTFQWIKQHYREINLFSGVFLIIIGIAMMTGWLGRLLSVLS